MRIFLLTVLALSFASINASTCENDDAAGVNKENIDGQVSVLQQLEMKSFPKRAPKINNNATYTVNGQTFAVFTKEPHDLCKRVLIYEAYDHINHEHVKPYHVGKFLTSKELRAWLREVSQQKTQTRKTKNIVD